MWLLVTKRKYRTWTYNLYTEEWRKHKILKDKLVPWDLYAACGIVIGKEIYIYADAQANKSELWRLTRNTNGVFTWDVVNVSPDSKKPSPRCGASAWEYEDKMKTKDKIFGGAIGFLQSQEGYLNNFGDFELFSTNQLLQFDIETKKWSDLKCLGNVPAPRQYHATTIRGNQVWLFGGINGPWIYKELYQLDMSTFTWTVIVTEHLKPQGRFQCSLNSVTNNHIVLHGGRSFPSGKDSSFKNTWIMDLASQSWKLFEGDQDQDQDEYRFGHTGSLGLNNDVIHVGGRNGVQVLCKHNFHMMLEPMTLQKIALKTAYKHLRELKCKKCLPKALLKLMDMDDVEEFTA